MADYSDAYEGDDRSDGPRGPAVNRLSLSEGRKKPKASLDEVRVTITIPHRLQYQQEELFKLRELISMLDDRITPLLGPDRPVPSEEDYREDSGMSDLARVLVSNTELVVQAQRGIQSLLDRVEL